MYIVYNKEGKQVQEFYSVKDMENYNTKEGETVQEVKDNDNTYVGWSLLGFWMFLSQVVRTHFN